MTILQSQSDYTEPFEPTLLGRTLLAEFNFGILVGCLPCTAREALEDEIEILNRYFEWVVTLEVTDKLPAKEMPVKEDAKANEPPKPPIKGKQG